MGDRLGTLDADKKQGNCDMKIRWIGMWAIALSLLPLPVQAYELSRDSQNRVYITGLQPRTTVYLIYGNRPRRARMRISGMGRDCGLYQFWHSSRFSLAGTVTITTPDGEIELVADELPRHTEYDDLPCNGTSVNPDLPWTAIAPGVQAVHMSVTGWNRSGDTWMVFVRGLSQYSTLQASDQVPGTRFGSTNTCGFVRFINSATWPASGLGSFWIVIGRRSNEREGSFTLESLPLREAIRCRNGVMESY
jgi:hypothetical protein